VSNGDTELGIERPSNGMGSRKGESLIYSLIEGLIQISPHGGSSVDVYIGPIIQYKINPDQWRMDDFPCSNAPINL
jgi:hypothetical protein